MNKHMKNTSRGAMQRVGSKLMHMPLLGAALHRMNGVTYMPFTAALGRQEQKQVVQGEPYRDYFSLHAMRYW
jgi:hypothetical protein